MQTIRLDAWARGLLLLLLLTGTGLLFWQTLNLETGNDYGEFILLERFIAKTAPPDDVAVELTGNQLQELAEAYDSGFDHPDPGNNDPCKRLQLLPHKKLSTWRKQFRKRGFTMEKIRDMLINGRRETFTHPQKGISYTKIFDEKGNWIVVDFIDCLIWQVAPYNFK